MKLTPILKSTQNKNSKVKIILNENQFRNLVKRISQLEESELLNKLYIIDKIYEKK